MTHGVGIAHAEDALNALENMAKDAKPIGLKDYEQRIAKAQQLMREQGIDAMYLNAGTNLDYFTGLKWFPSERLVGAIVPAEGEVTLLAPAFEVGSLTQAMQLPMATLLWEEHESPYELFVRFLEKSGFTEGKLALDESTPYSIVANLEARYSAAKMCDAKVITAECRMHKSAAELALIQTAMDMTMAVHRATGAMLHEGITASEVRAFIDEAHRRVGASGSFFCIVLFGKGTSYPHGVSYEQSLENNDWVLIDTGCKLHGYHSDITRTYAFGTPTEEQKTFWQYERQLQQAAFDAAQIGSSCESVDDAVRHELAQLGLKADYQLPGVPHRTGHGIGMDLHEWPYLVGGDQTPLASGMCFSNEPMVIQPEAFGVRLEDHFYMTDNGPVWFTEPSRSYDDPFNLA
ncbi:putative dipeptidase PepE [Pseudidiomarina piscicola]|uniref:Putative dipeptidase PepE n=1 Tax=Pseudidiomarina piscicola TaxID=2614830 RepID=A0A6S6WQ43_9GAMM|nr:Xaa-Pro peptidase family protein [Pseudidiomarina piscicola]CAB0151964.1 putative dipeptidase PepE [Pseudidiomarina piscicola]VZT41402.1 putative dipeptidase PepE [Pseudomonas aeruginosa]